MKGEYIPQAFRDFLDAVNHAIPALYFTPWPYQVQLFDKLFEAWEKRRDLRIRQCRQSGKTVPTAFWLAYMVLDEGCQEVITSTKTSKTRKLTRIIQRIMLSYSKANAVEMSAEGIDETRFADSAGYVALSGKVKAERESDTAHIILVDEGQDVSADPILGDLSPMRAGTGGIMVVMGVGGLLDPDPAKCSLLSHIQNNPDWLQLDIIDDEVIEQRPTYAETVEKDRKTMLPHIFAANYKLENYTSSGAALLPHIVTHESVRGTPFDPLGRAGRLYQLVVGIDWGQRLDASALVACAIRKEENSGCSDSLVECIIYRAVYFQGGGPELQLTLMVEALKDIPYDTIRPELNNLGDTMTTLLHDRLDAAGLLVNAAGFGGNVWQPVWADEAGNSASAKQLAMCSHIRTLLYNEHDGHMTAAVNNLRAVGVKYGVGGKLKTVHSDWLSALRCSVYPEKLVRL